MRVDSLAQDCCHSEDTERKFADISKVIDLYKGRQGSLIQVLHLAQEIYGYLPLELQQFIAKGMGIPVSEVSGVVSFYSFFSTVPRGEHTLRVCLGTACYVRGGKKNIDYLTEHLDVEAGQTTANGKFTFEIARCIGACGLAPALMVDETVHKQVTTTKLERILEDC